jgi:nucleoid-associated protein YgaU
VPSSATSFNPSGSGVSAPASTASDRRITRDTVIPWEYAVRGETFSSLSQRLYGDTSYAAALAEFNKEHDFVTLDQPQPNQVIAKPNREILEQRYPQLIPRMKASTYTPSSTAVNNMQRGNTTAAAPAESFKTYRVAKGEQLFEVAKKTLGDGYRWSEIYALNKEQLRDSTELRPDMVLKIPSTGGK